MRVIESKSFRWSSPTKFNDPFDNQTGFVLNISADEFANLLTSAGERIIFSDIAPVVNPVSPFAASSLHFQGIQDRLPRDRFLRILHECSLRYGSNLPDVIGKENARIQENLCHARVFCVSENHDNVVMWSHYADEHRGVVFKLGCIDKINNTLLVAREVSYTDAFLMFPSADQYVKHLTGEQPIDLGLLSLNIAFMKHIDWSYEKEWRVYKPLGHEPPGDGYTIYPENPRIFEAVYLGCRMEEEELATIVSLIRRHLPATKIYRSEKSKTAFALSFNELNGS